MPSQAGGLFGAELLKSGIKGLVNLGKKVHQRLLNQIMQKKKNKRCCKQISRSSS